MGDGYGLSVFLKQYCLFGLKNETNEYGTFENYQTTLYGDCNSPSGFEYYWNYSSTFIEGETTITYWSRTYACFELDSKTGLLTRFGLRSDIYDTNPFDEEGNLNKGVTADRTEDIDMSISYWEDGAKGENPDPVDVASIVF